MWKRNPLKKILQLTGEEASVILERVIREGDDEWDISFIRENDSLRLDEGKPVVCESLNLFLFTNEEMEKPSRPLPGLEVIGIFGDDEFAWVCRKSDGSIVEVDEYDLEKSQFEPDLIFPSLSHYLLFVTDWQG